MKKEHEQIIRLLQTAEDRNCTTCLHWQTNPELCKMYNERPPAAVIVKGCEQYDYIPF